MSDARSVFARDRRGAKPPTSVCPNIQRQIGRFAKQRFTWMSSSHCHPLSGAAYGLTEAEKSLTMNCCAAHSTSVAGQSLPSSDVRFSNRPFGVKRFQTIRRHSVDVAHGLVLLFGIGTKAVPSWDSKTRWNNLRRGLAGSCRQVQADMRTHLIHRPARDIVPPLGGARVSFYWM